MTTTTLTRARARAVEEAAGVVASLAGTIDDVTEQLNEARARLGALEEQWNDLGTEMAEDHALASSPYSSREDARKAIARFHEVKARREALDGPRREAASEVIRLQRHALYLRSGREEWLKRIDALEAGADPGELDRSGGSIAAPGRADGEGTVENPDAPTEPVGAAGVGHAAGALAGSGVAPAPEQRRVRGWWSW